MRPAAIVFDFDGVIANSEPLHLEAFQQVLATAGVHLPAVEYYERYLGYDDRAGIVKVFEDRGVPLAPARLQALLDEKAALLPRLLDGPAILVPGVEACLARLGAELPLAIASGALPGEIEHVLRARGLRHWFEAVVAVGDTPRSKPHPDPYAHAVALLRERGRIPPDTPPACCVAVEDSRWGLASARAAGLSSVGLTTSYPRSALSEADAVVDALDEITLPFLAELVRARC